MTRDDLAQALQRSSLSQGAAAAKALRDVWTMEVHPSETPYEQYASVYSIRSERLRRMSSLHARQLAASIEEFVANLDRGASGKWFFITGPGEHDFLVFCSDLDEPLACLRTVSQRRVSPERWNDLWR
jgi:hypothetical protein